MSTEVTLTLAELREWWAEADTRGRRLITAYRDTAIKAGEWWCECGKHPSMPEHFYAMKEDMRPLGPGHAYEPASLEAP